MPHNEQTAEAFLRSINIQYDANYPERVSHYRPTGKSVSLLKALAGQTPDRAFFVVAPYGTGKSITATYLLHLVENRPDADETLSAIEDKLKVVSPDLGKFSKERRKAKDKGLVLALQGYCRDLSASLKDAALKGMWRIKLGRQARTIASMPCETIDQAIELLVEVRDKARAAGCDRIVILWDEFGRHIESLISEGRSSALSEIQSLAEFVSRSKAIPVTLGLLLHQELLQYAGSMPQAVRTEWRKIEGRFQTIQYIDDSKEIYRLIAEAVSARSQFDKIDKRAIQRAVNQCRKLDIFSDFTRKELADLFVLSCPLEPVALYLLPRLSARVAQNERTLFSFLYHVDLTSFVKPDALYDFFSPDMRADSAVGGTYRQWLETQSALTKVGHDEDAVIALKIACLLGLGTSGERSRAGRELLEFALKGYIESNRKTATIDRLIEQKLLLHRKHSDEVSVWHGTDMDLRGRLEEEKNRYRGTFELWDFLTEEVRPPAWRPVRYNDEFCIRRYFVGEFQSQSTLRGFLSPEFQTDYVTDVSDGKIVYVTAETHSELDFAEDTARNHSDHDRAILAIPREPLPLFEAALEVWCLSQMQFDADLVDSDPLVVPELHQMADDARGLMQRLIDRLVHPASNGPRWFYRGAELDVQSPSALRSALSEIAKQVYPLTPKINNELIVRNKPSATIVNSRKKLLLGVLERSGQEMLGIEGNYPDASMFRTVLLHTGLYREDDDGRWRYAMPKEVEDEGLRGIWDEVRTFLTTPAKEPKDIQGFFNTLMAPPYGVRAGLLPILFGTGLKAFPSALSLAHEGKYVADVLPSVIEQLCREPDRYQLIVLDIDASKRDYLLGFYQCFAGEQAEDVPDGDLIRRCYDALEAWKAQLPPAALTTKQVSERARRFQTAIQRSSDPVLLLFERIPGALLGYSLDNCDAFLDALATHKQELDDVVGIFRKHAATSLRRAISIGMRDREDNIRECARSWAACFPREFVMQLTDGVAKGLLSRMQMRYDTDALFLDSLASLLSGQTTSRWDDSTIANFDREVQNVVRRIEEAALSADANMKDNGEAVQGLANLVSGRIGELIGRLKDLVGEEQAHALIAEQLTGETENGNAQGSTGKLAG